MLIFDAHLDLSMNAMEWNRDLRLPATEIRASEEGMTDLAGRGAGTVTLAEMRRGDIGVCVGTVLAPCARPENPINGWNSPEQSWAQIQGQLAWYRGMERSGSMRSLRSNTDLDEQIANWQADPENTPIGYILSLEGADPIVDLSDLEPLVVNEGLRAIGPAHYGPGRYAHGTDSEGGLNEQGRELVREMERLGVILDVTHLCDQSFWEAVELFNGPVWASHSNCRSLVDHNRQFSDEQLRYLIERDVVIGAVMDTWMVIPGWIRGETTPESSGVALHHLVDHIDHICQLAGNTRHCGIGSDLDGGFGKEQSPSDIDTIADLQDLGPLLSDRGYTDEDITAIFHGNFLRATRAAWDRS